MITKLLLLNKTGLIEDDNSFIINVMIILYIIHVIGWKRGMKVIKILFSHHTIRQTYQIHHTGS